MECGRHDSGHSRWTWMEGVTSGLSRRLQRRILGFDAHVGLAGAIFASISQARIGNVRPGQTPLTSPAIFSQSIDRISCLCAAYSFDNRVGQVMQTLNCDLSSHHHMMQPAIHRPSIGLLRFLVPVRAAPQAVLHLRDDGGHCIRVAQCVPLRRVLFCWLHLPTRTPCVPQRPAVRQQPLQLLLQPGCRHSHLCIHPANRRLEK